MEERDYSIIFQKIAEAPEREECENIRREIDAIDELRKIVLEATSVQYATVTTT